MTRVIDTGLVIDEVRKRPLLWHPAEINHRNMELRQRAWEDICRALYHDLPEREFDEMTTNINQRWRHTRDAYVKRKSNEKKAKAGEAFIPMNKYVHNDRLAFLDQTLFRKIRKGDAMEVEVEVDPLFENVSFVEMLKDDQTEEVEDKKHVKAAVRLVKKRKKIQKRPFRSSDPTYVQPSASSTLFQLSPSPPMEEDLNETAVSQGAGELSSDDLAFFTSLASTLHAFSSYQKLLFRSKVLTAAMEMQPKT